MRRLVTTFLFSITLILTSASFVFAADGPLDQRCYTQADCRAAREEISANADPNQGFIVTPESNDRCGAQMYGSNGKLENAGFCLPTSHAKTTIAIGGRTEFTDMATYIAFIYKYSLIIAASIAVIMIILGGLRWMSSTGDAKAVQDAKKRIAHAITGLLLLASSFVILRTINPALTELRLPQVWMIRGSKLQNPWCRNVAGDDIPLALAREAGSAAFAVFRESMFSGSTIRKENAACGNDYYIAGTSGQTCRGHVCDPAGSKTCFLDKDGSPQPSCVDGNLVGTVYSSDLFEKTPGSGVWIGRHVLGVLVDGVDEGWVWQWLSDGGLFEESKDNVDMWIACKNGDFEEVNEIMTSDPTVTKNDANYTQFYSISMSEQKLLDVQISKCGGRSQTRGFLLALDLNEFSDGWSDDRHFLGNNGGKAIDLGDEGAPDKHNSCLFALPGVQQYFISERELLQGLQLNVDLSRVVDIDDWEDESTPAYQHLGYSYAECD